MAAMSMSMVRGCRRLPGAAARCSADHDSTVGAAEEVAGQASSSCASISTTYLRSGQRSTRERSEEHTSELQSLMRISYAVFCLKKKNNITIGNTHIHVK